MHHDESALKSAERAAPIEEMLANMRDHVERSHHALSMLAERLHGVLQPERDTMATPGTAELTEVRQPTSPILDQLIGLDNLIISLGDRASDLRARLDV